MGARNHVGIGLSYFCPARLHRLSELITWNGFLGSLRFKNTTWPARLHRLAELVIWDRFRGSLNVYNFGLYYPKVLYSMVQ
jgi:hypothetical protein